MPTQLTGGEVFTDVSPGKSVTSTRLNNHIGAGYLLKGAVTEQPALTEPAGDDALLGTDASNSDTLSKLTVANIRKVPTEYASGNLSGAVYLVTLAPSATAYVAGQRIVFKANNPNAGAVDVNVNGLGAQNIFKGPTTELAANDILINQVVELIYDGTNFQMIVPTPGAGTLTSTMLTEAVRQDGFQYGAGIYGAGTYVVTLAPAMLAYAAGMVVRFKADTANTATGAVDVNVNGIGPKNIFKNNGVSELVAGDILINQMVELRYDGTNFQFMGPTRSPDFNSGNLALPGSGTAVSTAHGLAVIPSRIRVVLVMINAAADLGYNQNDEVDISAGSSWQPSANVTNITLAQINLTNPLILPKAGGAAAAIANAKWNYKILAWL